MRKRNKTREGKRNRLVGIVLFLLLASISVIGMFADQWRKEKRAIHLTINGAELAAPVEIERLASLPDSTSLADLDLAQIRNRLKRHPLLRAVYLSRNPPDELLARVVEREPMALVVTSSDEEVYVDTEGYVLPSLSSPKLVDLPLISGIPPDFRMISGTRIILPRFQQALDILTTAERMDGEIYHLISEISIAHERDLILYTIDNGIPIIFGPSSGTERKLRYLAAFWKEVVLKTGSAHLEYVDVRFSERVVVKWNEDFLQPEQAVQDSIITEL